MHQSLKTQSILSVLIILLGISLLIFMIKVEDEPGALPLLLILGGTIWLTVTRLRLKKHKY